MNDRKKVLFVTTVPQTLIAFLLPFAAYFRQKGWIVDAMAAGVEQFPLCKENFDQCWNIHLSRNPLNIKNFFRTVKRIREVVLRQQYDIVNVHTPVAAFITRYALRNLRPYPKVIYTAHGFHFHPDGFFILNFIFKCIEKIAGKWTDALIVINQHDLSAAKKIRLVPDSNLYYAPGIGVDINYYHSIHVSDEQVRALREELNLTSREKILLMIGEFTAQKRQVLAVKALFKLKNPDLHVVFAGEGKKMQYTKKLSEKLGLSRNVHFLGFRRDIPVLMKASNVILSLSKREGLPRCLLEAMALGTPIIGSNIRGIDELLQNDSGLMVRSGCLLSLVQAIQLLIDDTELQRKIAANAQNKIQAYDISKVLNIYSLIYEQVLL